jgi:hypothetical protein
VQEGGVVSGAAVIELEELSPDDLANYLPRTVHAEEDGVSTKWDTVVERMRDQTNGQGQVVFAVLNRPLMAFLARSIYSMKSNKPIELLDSTRFPNSTSIVDHLLGKYIDVKYEIVPNENATSASRSSASARRWLGFLAALQISNGVQEFDFRKLYTQKSSFLSWPTLGIILALVTLFMHVLPFGLSITPDAVWKNATLVYDGREYDSGIEAEEMLGFPEASVVFTNSDRTVLPWHMRYIYLPSGVDPNTATYGYYVSADADFELDNPYSNVSTAQRISIQKYASPQEDYQHPGFWLSLHLGALLLIYFFLLWMMDDWLLGESARLWRLTRPVIYCIATFLAAMPSAVYADRELGPEWDWGPLLQQLPYGTLAGPPAVHFDRELAKPGWSSELELFPLVALAVVVYASIFRGALGVFTKELLALSLRGMVGSGLALMVLDGIVLCGAAAASIHILFGSIDDLAGSMLPAAAIIFLLVTVASSRVVPGVMLIFAHLQMSLRGLVPMHLSWFLDDAYARGILRRSGSMYEFRHANLRSHLALTFIADERWHFGLDKLVASCGQNLLRSDFDAERLAVAARAELTIIFRRGEWSARREEVVVSLLHVLRRHDRVGELLNDCRLIFLKERSWRRVWRAGYLPRVGWSRRFLRRFTQELALIEMQLELGDRGGAYDALVNCVELDEALWDRLEPLDLKASGVVRAIKVFPRWAASCIAHEVWKIRYAEVFDHLGDLKNRLDEKGDLHWKPRRELAGTQTGSSA